jgi:hypothetical protein
MFADMLSCKMAVHPYLVDLGWKDDEQPVFTQELK